MPQPRLSIVVTLRGEGFRISPTCDVNLLLICIDEAMGCETFSARTIAEHRQPATFVQKHVLPLLESAGVEPESLTVDVAVKTESPTTAQLVKKRWEDAIAEVSQPQAETPKEVDEEDPPAPHGGWFFGSKPTAQDLRTEARDIECGAPDGRGYAQLLRELADMIE